VILFERQDLAETGLDAMPLSGPVVESGNLGPRRGLEDKSSGPDIDDPVNGPKRMGSVMLGFLVKAKVVEVVVKVLSSAILEPADEHVPDAREKTQSRKEGLGLLVEIDERVVEKKGKLVADGLFLAP